MFLGYYKNPEASAADMKDGWMHSGDAGYFNGNQQLVVIDRIKDLAETARGERFSPQYIENKLKFSPYIAETVVLGAGRDALAAMICIRFSIISKWAEKNRISFTTYTDLASRPEVYALLRKEVEAVNATLPPAQRISKFLLLYKELDADDGELTRTRKVRRSVINEKYADIIDAIYGGERDIPIDTVIRFQDGTTQRIRTTLAVVDLAPRRRCGGGRGMRQQSIEAGQHFAVPIDAPSPLVGEGITDSRPGLGWVRGTVASCDAEEPLTRLRFAKPPSPTRGEGKNPATARRQQHEHPASDPASGQRPRGRHALWRGRDVVRADLQGDPGGEFRAGRIAADRRLGVLGAADQIPGAVLARHADHAGLHVRCSASRSRS